MGIAADELEAMRDELMRARASGTRSVRFSDGRAVEYKTDGEMAAAIAAIDRQIAQARSPRAGGLAFSASKGV